MRKAMLVTAAVLTGCLSATTGFCAAKKGEKVDGMKKFEEHCAVCHPNGENIVNKLKTLRRKELKANGVNNAKDIIGKMRNPGPGMTKFDDKTISNAEAKAIAEYVLKTFK